MIRDVWSGAEERPVTFTSSTYHLLDFSMAVYCGDKSQLFGHFFPLSFSWIRYL